MESTHFRITLFWPTNFHLTSTISIPNKSCDINLSFGILVRSLRSLLWPPWPYEVTNHSDFFHSKNSKNLFKCLANKIDSILSNYNYMRSQKEHRSITQRGNSKENRGRECISIGAAGPRICRSLRHRILHPLILRVLVLCAPTDFETQRSLL